MRTAFTFLSITVAFVLFGLMRGITSGFEQVIDDQAKDVLSVRPRFQGTLPIAYLERIRRIPGVAAVAPMARMNASYQQPDNNVAVIMTDPASYRAAQYRVEISSDELNALVRSRTAAVVTVGAAKQFGWKVGDKIPLNTTTVNHDGTTTWTFDIVGVFRFPVEPDIVALWGHYAYFDEGRMSNVHTVIEFVVRVVDASQADGISTLIDNLFANSSYPTRTQSQQQEMKSFASQVGDVSYLVTTVIGAALFTLLSLTGHVTMQAVRERIPEFAVMKVIGFRDLVIFQLILAEALLLSVGAAAVGLAIAWVLYPKIFPLPVHQLSTGVIMQGLGVTLLLALASTVAPAWRLGRLQIAAALSGH
jgi:putative ABC transport system permease protein